MSSVYFIKTSKNETQVSITQKINLLFDTAGFKNCIETNDLVAVKVHFGEGKNTTHLKPYLIAPVIEKIKKNKGKPFLTDTNTLYSGGRSNAVDHLHLAHRHGWTIENVGAPVIISDGLIGRNEIEVEISGKYYKKVPVATEIIMANALFVISHPTGHIATGFAGAIKNLGMGTSSRKGKLNQHSSILPEIIESKCQKCDLCIKWCPVNTIVMKDKSAFIISAKCIGCAECLAVCKYKAVKFSWGVSSNELQEKIAEHAYGAVIDKKNKVAFLNFIIDVTKDCDCINEVQKPFVESLGILASYDPVAIDQASIDLIEKETGENFNESAYSHLNHTAQLGHSEKIGLGNRNYKLIEVQN